MNVKKSRNGLASGYHAFTSDAFDNFDTQIRQRTGTHPTVIPEHTPRHHTTREAQPQTKQMSQNFNCTRVVFQDALPFSSTWGSHVPVIQDFFRRDIFKSCKGMSVMAQWYSSLVLILNNRREPKARVRLHVGTERGAACKRFQVLVTSTSLLQKHTMEHTGWQENRVESEGDGGT